MKMTDPSTDGLRPLTATRQELSDEDEAFVREYQHILDNAPYRTAKFISIPTESLARLLSIIRETQWFYAASANDSVLEGGENVR